MTDFSSKVCAFVYKPVGMTSADVVHKIKRTFPGLKIGHGGTLDPFAEGLLPVFFGNWTKLSSLFSFGDKRYQARLKLGSQTDTGDHTGKVIKTSKFHAITDLQLTLLKKKLSGPVHLPIPIYSALKIEGRPMYELARKGLLEKSVKSRTTEIYELNLKYLPQEQEIFIDVWCSHGTYIRSLAEEIAKNLGQCGHLIALKRLAYGNKNIPYTFPVVSLEEILEKKPVELLSLGDLEPFLPIYKTQAQLFYAITRGQKNKLPFRYEGWHLLKVGSEIQGALFLNRGRIEQRIFLEVPKKNVQNLSLSITRRPLKNLSWARDWLAD